MRTIAVVNQKGGVGKTTITINLAASLAREGQRVLIIDMDPQGHCAVGLSVSHEKIVNGVFECLMSQRTDSPIGLDRLTWQIAANLELVPSRAKLADLPKEHADCSDAETFLGSALSLVAHKYDYCVIDCPPQPGLLMQSAVHAASEVIIPVEPAYLSLCGLSRQMEMVRDVSQETGREYRIRILPNQYDVRTKQAREILAELRRRFGDTVFQTAINFNTKLREGVGSGQPITEFDPTSAGARDFRALATEVVGMGDVVTRHVALERYADQIGRDSDRLLATSAPLIRPERLVAAAAPAHTARPAQPVPVRRPIEPRPLERVASVSHERIDEKLEQVYGVRQMPEGVVFRSNCPGARSVQLAGDFNDWMPQATPMDQRGRNDEFEVVVPLGPGRYRYRLVVDGRWSRDLNNPEVESNEYGEINSVVDVV